MMNKDICRLTGAVSTCLFSHVVPLDRTILSSPAKFHKTRAIPPSRARLSLPDNQYDPNNHLWDSIGRANDPNNGAGHLRQFVVIQSTRVETLAGSTLSLLYSSLMSEWAGAFRPTLVCDLDACMKIAETGYALKAVATQ
jgi:hypothetical protein